MRSLLLAASLLIAFSLVGCGAEKTVTMPDVAGVKLDVAYDKINNAGFTDKDKIKIEGGGTFGVLMESNWTVCKQSPAAGETVLDAPTLTIDRTCGNEAPTASLSADPTPSPSVSATPVLPAILTAKNNKDFKAILGLGDNCSDKITSFAKKYEGQTVRFDGSIVNVAPHGDYNTRFDFLLGPGDFDPNKAIGPSFQFRDKNVVPDLKLTGMNIPENVEVGQNYTFTAELGEFDPDTCLYQLNPVETRAR